MNQQSSFYGWKLVVFFFIIYFMNAIPYYSAGIIAPYMAPDLGMSRSALGWGSTIWIIVVGLGAPLVGQLIISHGVRVLITAGSLTMAVGAALMGFAGSQTWHYLLFMGLSLGLGFSFSGLLSIQSGIIFWFDKRRALALGIVIAAPGFAAIVAAALINRLIVNNNGDWRIGWYVVSAACVISAIVAALTIRNKPEDIGQHIDGIDPKSNENQPDDSQSSPHRVVEQWDTKDAIKTSAFWLIVIGSVGYVCAPISFFIHGVIYLREIGHSADAAAAALGLTVALGIIGRIGGGILSDQLSPKVVMITAMFLIALGVFVLLNDVSRMQILLVASTLGVGYGACLVAGPAMIANYYGSDNFPKTFGLMMLVATLISGFAPAIAGYVYDAQGTYAPAFSVFMLLALAGSGLILAARKPKQSIDKR